MSSKISIEEYRNILNDYESSDDLIIKRLQYFEGFIRNIIKIELKKSIDNKTNYHIKK